MHDLQPTKTPRDVTVGDRVRGALAPVTASVVPGTLVGALYLATGSHWAAMKATVAAWGVAPNLAALAAPVVGIAAVAACRYLWRLANPPDDDPSP